MIELAVIKNFSGMFIYGAEYDPELNIIASSEFELTSLIRCNDSTIHKDPEYVCCMVLHNNLEYNTHLRNLFKVKLNSSYNILNFCTGLDKLEYCDYMIIPSL